MAFNQGGSAPRRRQADLQALPPSDAMETDADQPSFDIFEWYPHHESCRRYFLDQAQHSVPVQALAAFVNIVLPCQRHHHPVMSSAGLPSRPGQPRIPSPIGSVSQRAEGTGNPQAISLLPYVRRLVATGMDLPGIMHGWFGDDWIQGVGPMHETERRNFLFAAKSTSWLKVKQSYDMSPHESIPFLRPIQSAQEAEIESAEHKWSDWLAMQDWMVGPRAPDGLDGRRVKPEPED